MDRQQGQSISTQPQNGTAITPERPVYEAPRVTPMDDTDLLKAFQFTSAGISWWVN